jgi:hypothetical protein
MGPLPDRATYGSQTAPAALFRGHLVGD